MRCWSWCHSAWPPCGQSGLGFDSNNYSASPWRFSLF